MAMNLSVKTKNKETAKILKGEKKKLLRGLRLQIDASFLPVLSRK